VNASSNGAADDLSALVSQAWELRETPYLIDACKAIEDWYFRLPLSELERRQERNAWLIRILRETAPAHP
jgi:hypothetical protein